MTSLFKQGNFCCSAEIFLQGCQTCMHSTCPKRLLREIQFFVRDTSSHDTFWKSLRKVCQSSLPLIQRNFLRKNKKLCEKIFWTNVLGRWSKNNCWTFGDFSQENCGNRKVHVHKNFLGKDCFFERNKLFWDDLLTPVRYFWMFGIFFLRGCQNWFQQVQNFFWKVSSFWIESFFP